MKTESIVVARDAVCSNPQCPEYQKKQPARISANPGFQQFDPSVVACVACGADIQVSVREES
jgi:hypothetical protein